METREGNRVSAKIDRIHEEIFVRQVMAFISVPSLEVWFDPKESSHSLTVTRTDGQNEGRLAGKLLGKFGDVLTLKTSPGQLVLSWGTVPVRSCDR